MHTLRLTHPIPNRSWRKALSHRAFMTLHSNQARIKGFQRARRWDSFPSVVF
jgi:hypothetical protein